MSLQKYTSPPLHSTGYESELYPGLRFETSSRRRKSSEFAVGKIPEEGLLETSDPPFSHAALTWCSSSHRTPHI